MGEQSGPGRDWDAQLASAQEALRQRAAEQVERADAEKREDQRFAEKWKEVGEAATWAYARLTEAGGKPLTLCLESYDKKWYGRIVSNLNPVALVVPVYTWHDRVDIDDYFPSLGRDHTLWSTARGELVVGERDDSNNVIARGCAYGCDPKQLAINNRTYVSRNDKCPFEHYIYGQDTDNTKCERVYRSDYARPSLEELASGIVNFVAAQLDGK